MPCLSRILSDIMRHYLDKTNTLYHTINIFNLLTGNVESRVTLGRRLSPVRRMDLPPPSWWLQMFWCQSISKHNTDLKWNTWNHVSHQTQRVAIIKQILFERDEEVRKPLVSLSSTCSSCHDNALWHVKFAVFWPVSLGFSIPNRNKHNEMRTVYMIFQVWF